MMARTPLPPSPGDDDPGPDGHFAWLVRELDAGRVQPPPEPAVEGPAVSLSLGDACDVDPGLLAAMCGPDGLGGQAVGAAFGQDQAADALRPGRSSPPSPPRRSPAPASLTDNELIGVLQAGRRLANLAEYQQTVVIAEFARRRQAAFEAARARGVPAGCRAGEFPGEELAMELVDTGAYTAGRVDAAVELTARLPRTLAGMAGGTIDLARACTIASRTRAMSDADCRLRRRGPRRSRPGAAAGPAGQEGRRAGDEARPGGGPGPQGARQALGPAGRDPPRGIRQRVPGRPGAGHRRRDRLQGPHRRDRGQAPRLRPGRGHPRHAPRPGTGRPHPGPRPPRPHQAQPGGRPSSTPAPDRRNRPRPWRTQTTPRPAPPPGAAACPGQPPGPGRDGPRLGHHPRPGRRLGPARRRRNPSSDRGRLSAPENALVLYPYRSRRHRDRPRLRKGPAPLETTRPTRPADGRENPAASPHPSRQPG